MRSKHITKTTRLENLFLTKWEKEERRRKKKANSELFLKTSADILFIWFPRKFLRQHSHKVQNDFSTFPLQFVPYFSKFIIIFQLFLRRIHRVALEIAGEKLYISQLPGLQYKKKFLWLAPAMQDISHMQIKQINSEK